MSQCHMSDSVFSHLHRWQVGLVDLVDEAWLSDTLIGVGELIPWGPALIPHELDFDLTLIPGGRLSARQCATAVRH